MGLKREYNGKTYYRNNSKWVDEDCLVVPVYLQNILNTRTYNENNAYDMSYEEAKKEGDKCKKSETYPLAIKYYEYALKKRIPSSEFPQYYRELLLATEKQINRKK